MKGILIHEEMCITKKRDAKKRDARKRDAKKRVGELVIHISS